MQWNKAEGRERDSDKVRAAWAAARILAEAAVSTLVEFDQDVNEERGRLEDKAPKNGRGTIIRPNNVKLKLRSFIALTEPA
jgi:hypothetical protein